MLSMYIDVDLLQARERSRLLLLNSTDGLAHALEHGTMRELKFEQLYQCVYTAISRFSLGDVWYRSVERTADRLVVAFRNDVKGYNRATAAMRDVSLFPDTTYCALHGLPKTTEIFREKWTLWHADAALRAWTLWGRVRSKRVALRIVACLLGLYEEVSLRPGHSKFQAIKARFESTVAEHAL